MYSLVFFSYHVGSKTKPVVPKALGVEQSIFPSDTASRGVCLFAFKFMIMLMSVPFGRNRASKEDCSSNMLSGERVYFVNTCSLCR
jgi:hypothetical protein